MQLKIRRSQREGGVLAKNVVFCLDARADLTQQERANLARYKLYDQIIYHSAAAQRRLDRSIAATDTGTALGVAKGFVNLAIMSLHLKISVRSLERGHHIECKSMEELLAGEDAIMQACQQLKIYLDIAATFNGSEMVVDFLGDQPSMIAQAIRPEPILAPLPEQVLVHAAPELTYEPKPATSAPFEEPWDTGSADPAPGAAASEAGYATPSDGFHTLRGQLERTFAEARQSIEDFLGQRQPAERVVIVGFVAMIVLIVLARFFVA